MMPAVARDKLTERPAFFIQHPDGTVPIRLMVDINANVQAGVVGYDVADVYGFEMPTCNFP